MTLGIGCRMGHNALKIIAPACQTYSRILREEPSTSNQHFMACAFSAMIMRDDFLSQFG